MNKQGLTMEKQGSEIKKLQRMMDPLRLSLQRYCDQAEQRSARLIEKQLQEQRQNNSAAGIRYFINSYFVLLY